jgi:polygalacturonase
MKPAKWQFRVIGLLLFACVADAAAFNAEKAQQQEADAWADLPVLLSRIQPPAFSDRTLVLTDSGGKGDGIFDNRPVFERAIAALAEEGGGKLTVPEGIFLVDGPIVMRSNIHIELKKGATIRFTSNPASYLPAVKQRWEGTICYNYSPLIRGHNLQNLALTGKGTIDGGAADWSHSWKEKQGPDKDRLRKMGNARIPEQQRVFGNGFLDLDGDGKNDGYGDGEPHYLRPPLIQFFECGNILFEGLTITGSPFWTVNPVFCRNVIARNLTIKSHSPNDDGFDPDSCEDVLVENCVIDTRDDAISIKAGRDQDAWDRPGSRNIIIRNNTLKTGANAICVGSEMSGGVENVYAENNLVLRAGNALKFKSNLDRGGHIRSIYVRNMTVEYCHQSLVDFTTDYHGHRGGNFPVQYEDFIISDVSCKSIGRAAFEIVGAESRPIRRVFFNNVHVDNAPERHRITYAEDIIFHNVTANGELTEWPVP